jgi:hypothetical protein
MLGHIIYTYDRLDDARVQQEISTFLYPKAFGGVHLVHAYNGEESFGYTPYLENHLIVRQNKGHYRGAVDLINAGLAYFDEAGLTDVRYVLVTASDTWAVDAGYLQDLVAKMGANGQVVAASSWRTEWPAQLHGFSLDFFLIDRHWNSETAIFPLDYDAFYNKYAEVLGLMYIPPIPEAAFQTSYHGYFLSRYLDNDVLRQRDLHFRRIPEREPAAIRENARGREMTGIWHTHSTIEKQEMLRALGLSCGEHSNKLMMAEDLRYFNLSASIAKLNA